MSEYSEVKEMLSLIMLRLDCLQVSDEPYGEYLLRWFSLYKEPTNRSNTSAEMLRYINKYILPAIGKTSLKDLSGDRLQVLLNSIPKTNTREKVALILHGSLEKAVKLHLLRFNPYDTVELRRHRVIHYKPLNSDQQRELLSLIDREFYRSVMAVLICTGMRIGEFLAIDFDQIDFDSRFVFVDRTVDIRTGVLRFYTKTESSIRKIPFDRLLERDFRRIANAKKRGQSLTYNAVKEYFKKRYRKMDVKRNIHSFRHTFVSMAYYVSIEPKTIQKIVGHATLEMTMNVYTHILNPDDSPYIEYFKLLKMDLKKRPTDFFDADIV